MSHDNIDLAVVLHEKGYRMTPQRQMILDAVCESGGHAAPEQIFELVRGKSQAINRATVYRTLKFLQKIELIMATTTPDGRVVYEMAGQGPHHHLRCRVCGVDLELADDRFAELRQQLFEEYDFRVESMHVTLQGLCSHCQPIQSNERD